MWLPYNKPSSYNEHIGFVLLRISDKLRCNKKVIRKPDIKAIWVIYVKTGFDIRFEEKSSTYDLKTFVYLTSSFDS